jgi:transcriptional regulator with XRE-family HTH domain
MGRGTREKWPVGGKKLRELRLAHKLSHDDLGAIVGTSRQHLIRLEKGWHRPKDELMEKLASALGVSIEELDEGQREEQESELDGEPRAVDIDALLRGYVRAVIRDELAKVAA